ncbi:MAG: MFS transporter [Opitutaceae bacterium]
MQTAPPAPNPSSSSTPATDATTPKTWHVGTLTYTTGGLIVLFVWLLFGDFAWSMRDRSIWPMASWYLNELKVPGLLFGLLMTSFPAMVSMTLIPVISMKSDRHRGRWGRRIPFLLITTPIAAFGMIGLGLTPIIARWMHAQLPEQNEMVVAVICFGVFWAVFEFASLAGQAVFGGLINDVVPKHLLGRFYGIFRAVSLIDGIIFNFWLTGKIPTHYTTLLVVIGTFYGCAFTWMCFRVKEGEYAPPPPKATRKAGVKTYFRECFSNRYYIAVFLMMMAAGLAFTPINTFSIPYAKSLGVDMDHYGKALATTYLASLILAYFLGWLADRFHPLRVSIATMVGYLAVTACGALFATTPSTFLLAFILHGVLSGCYFTSAASLGQRLFPHERFAQFASAAGIVMAPANIVLAPLVGLFIDGSGGAYRLTFVAGCGMSLLAILIAWKVHRQFMQLGGPNGYIAPE